MAVHKAQLNTPNLRCEIKLIKRKIKQRIPTHTRAVTLTLTHTHTQEQ